MSQKNPMSSAYPESSCYPDLIDETAQDQGLT